MMTTIMIQIQNRTRMKKKTIKNNKIFKRATILYQKCMKITNKS